MDNRGIDQEPGWINRQLRELRQAIEALRSERRAGATTVDGNFTVSGGGDIRILDDSGAIVFSAMDGPLRTAAAQGDLNSVNFTTTWADYCVTNITVPMGYTQAVIQVFVSAGVIPTAEGDMAIRAVAGGVVGPAQTNGAPSGVISVGSGLAAKVPVAAGAPLVVKAQVYVNPTTMPGTGHAHLSATVIFTRT